MINYTDNYFDLELLRLSEIKLHEATESIRLRNIYNRIIELETQAQEITKLMKAFYYVK